MDSPGPPGRQTRAPGGPPTGAHADRGGTAPPLPDAGPADPRKDTETTDVRLRCAVLDDFQAIATSVADWSPVQDRVEVAGFTGHFATEDEPASALADFDMAVTLRERVPFPASLLDRLPRLKLLVASGMRNSAIDHAAAARNGVTVCGTENSPTPPVELTWALLLGLARGIVAENEALRSNGPWQSTVGADLHGRRPGLLGLGKTGGRVARVGLAFGMEVAAWSENLTEERADEAGVRLASSKEELLRESDFVSVHLVLGERTRGLVGPPSWPCSSPPRTWSTPPARPSSTRRPCSPRCTRAGSPGRASTSSTSSRCPRTTRCAPRPGSWPPRTSATSRGTTTAPTTGRPSRTSRRTWPAARCASSADVPSRGSRTARTARPVAPRPGTREAADPGKPPVTGPRRRAVRRPPGAARRPAEAPPPRRPGERGGSGAVGAPPRHAPPPGAGGAGPVARQDRTARAAPQRGPPAATTGVRRPAPAAPPRPSGPRRRAARALCVPYRVRETTPRTAARPSRTVPGQPPAW